MASIKKDKERGTYYFVLDLPPDPVTGKRKQVRRRGFQNKKMATEAANKLHYELTKGTYVTESDISFEDFCDAWLSYYEKLGRVKISTVNKREKEINTLKKFLKSIPIQKITKKMYQDTIIDIKHKLDFSDNTIKGVHGCARMIFKRALEQEVIKNDPTQYAVLPRKSKSVEDIENKVELPKYLEKEELALFLKTAEEQGLDGDYETFLTLAYTGMRVGEFLVLKETDIDFEEHTISITKTYFNPNNNTVEYSLLTPKTSKSIRKIQVEPIVTTAIKEYIASNKSFVMLHRKTYYNKGFIMPNKDRNPGYPLNINHIRYRMRRIMKLAGINKKLSPHSFRHTHTSLLAELEIPLQEIMDRLGHKDDYTTKNVYTHVTKTKKKEASHKFGELMRSL